MSKLKNRNQKHRQDSRTGGLRADFLQGFQPSMPVYGGAVHCVPFPVATYPLDTVAMTQAQASAMHEVIMGTVPRKARKIAAPALATLGRRGTIERFGPISIHTAVVETPAGPRVRSSLDCEDVWYGSPEDLSDEDLASFGLGG